MKSTINIVSLIEHNPISKLSTTYNSKLLNRIQSAFTNEEEQLFINSFYCSLNYNQFTDFIIDLDDIWQWVGFSQKVKAKTLLEKHFKENTDYILSLSQEVKRTDAPKGGQNKQKFLLTIRAFKLFCLKAGTQKANQIHEYYLKLEDILQETLLEESDEIRNQLQAFKIDKNLVRETTLLEQFPLNTQCIYYGIIDNLSDKGERLIKFGLSNNLKNRVKQHKDTYTNFYLVNAFKVSNNVYAENELKAHPLFIERQRSITIVNKRYIELINAEQLSFEELDSIIKHIIANIEYNPTKFLELKEEVKQLKLQLADNINIKNDNELILLRKENERLKADNLFLIKKYKLTDIEINKVNENIIVTKEDLNNYENVVNTQRKQQPKKLKDGTYIIEGKNYKKIYGTREEVWNEIAHRTTGDLKKDRLILSKEGKVVSKCKSAMESKEERFIKYGVNKPKPTIDK